MKNFLLPGASFPSSVKLPHLYLPWEDLGSFTAEIALNPFFLFLSHVCKDDLCLQFVSSLKDLLTSVFHVIFMLSINEVCLGLLIHSVLHVLHAQNLQTEELLFLKD